MPTTPAASRSSSSSHRCRVVAPHGEAARIPLVDETVRENDKVKVGALEARVFETPGHTAGHISYFFPADKLAFVGDTLFSIGCGRVIEGTPEMMWQSLLKLRGLPDDTRIYCGHEYTKANIRFANTIEPDNAALAAREAEVEKLLAAQQADHPLDHRRGKGGQPVPARRRAGGGEGGRACRQSGVEGVRRNPRAQEQSGNAGSEWRDSDVRRLQSDAVMSGMVRDGISLPFLPHGKGSRTS